MIHRLILHSIADHLQIYALGLICFIPQATPSTYLTLSLRSLGFTTVRKPVRPFEDSSQLTTLSQFQTNLLVIPSQCVAILNLLLLTWMSERTGQRLYIAAIQSLWYDLPFFTLQKYHPIIPQQDPSLHNRPACLARRLSRSMAHIRPPNRPAQLPLLPRHPRRPHLSQFRRRTHTLDLRSMLQHDGADGRSDLGQYLSRGR